MKELKTIRDILNAILLGHEVEINKFPQNTWEPVVTVYFDIQDLDNEKAVPRKFRIKPSKPSIGWSQVSEKYNYLARDEDGQVFIYENKPGLAQDYWWINGGLAISASLFQSLEVGNCDWTESLVERPKE